MIGLVIVSHGALAAGLKSAAEMIVGPQSGVRTVAMDAAADLDQLRSQIEAAVEEVGGVGAAVVLVDVMGGSPGNASAYLAMRGTPVVCGVNLPMLLEVLMQRDTETPPALAERALQAGRDSIIDLGRQLRVGSTR